MTVFSGSQKKSYIKRSHKMYTLTCIMLHTTENGNLTSNFLITNPHSLIQSILLILYDFLATTLCQEFAVVFD